MQKKLLFVEENGYVLVYKRIKKVPMKGWRDQPVSGRNYGYVGPNTPSWNRSWH